MCDPGVRAPIGEPQGASSYAAIVRPSDAEQHATRSVSALQPTPGASFSRGRADGAARSPGGHAAICAASAGAFLRLTPPMLCSQPAHTVPSLKAVTAGTQTSPSLSIVAQHAALSVSSAQLTSTSLTRARQRTAPRPHNWAGIPCWSRACR